MSLSVPGSICLHVEAAWGWCVWGWGGGTWCVCSFCSECVLRVFGGHCSGLAAERRLGFKHHVSALHPAAVSLSLSAHQGQQTCNHSLSEQGVEMRQRDTWRRRRNHSTQRRRGSRGGREMTAEGVSQSGGGRALLSQPARL